jgi:hypothetical protein
MRSLRFGKSAAILVLGIAIGAAGTAAAASATFLLGRANHETSSSSLSNTGSGFALRVIASHNTPLVLSAPVGKPPFIVNSSKEVVGLNASMLGGRTAASFSTSGAKAWAFWNRSSLVASRTFGVLSINHFATGEFCLTLAPGITSTSTVMVTPDFRASVPGGELGAYDAVGVTNCQSANQIAVVTLQASAFSNGIAFEVVVF